MLLLLLLLLLLVLPCFASSSFLICLFVCFVLFCFFCFALFLFLVFCQRYSQHSVRVIQSITLCAQNNIAAVVIVVLRSKSGIFGVFMTLVYFIIFDYSSIVSTRYSILTLYYFFLFCFCFCFLFTFYIHKNQKSILTNSQVNSCAQTYL